MNVAKYRISAAIGLVAALPLTVFGCAVGPADEEEPIDSAALADAVSEPALSSEILRLTNVERQNQGLAPLQWSLCLSLSARAHALNVAKSGITSHDLHGLTPIGRMRRTGYLGATLWRENMHDAWSTGDIGAAYPGRAVQWWMGSAGHRANILNPSLTHIGVGVAKIEREGRIHYYAVQNFAAGGTCRPMFWGYRAILR